MSLGDVYDVLFRSGFLILPVEFQKTCTTLRWMANTKEVLDTLIKMYKIPLDEKSNYAPAFRGHVNIWNNLRYLVSQIEKYYLFQSYLERERCTKTRLIESCTSRNLSREAYERLRTYNQKSEIVNVYELVSKALSYKNIVCTSVFIDDLDKYEIGYITNLIISCGNYSIIERANNRQKLIGNFSYPSAYFVLKGCILNGSIDRYKMILDLLKFNEITLNDFCECYITDFSNIEIDRFNDAIKIIKYIYSEDPSLGSRAIIYSYTRLIEKKIDQFSDFDIEWDRLCFNAVVKCQRNTVDFCLTKVSILKVLDYASSTRELLVSFLRSLKKQKIDWIPVVYWLALNNHKQEFLLTFPMIGSDPIKVIKLAHEQGTRYIVQENCENFYK